MNSRKIRVYLVSGEGFNRLSDDLKNNLHNNDLLRQIAILRWGYDENKLDDRINNLISDLSGLKSFYVYATKGDWQVNTPIIGIAYFCQDENNEKHWYYGDLTIRTKLRFRRLGIATRMIDMAMLELRGREALKLFTYVDKDDKFSILLHKKLSLYRQPRNPFIPGEEQKSINGFDKNDKIVYECML
jgi:hypothetical protein